MDAILNGGSPGNNVHTILSDLEDTLRLKAVKNSSRLQRIFGGDLIISVDILSKIAEYNRIHGNVSSPRNFKKFAQAASHLLEKKNSQTWTECYDVSEVLILFINIAVPSLGTEKKLEWVQADPVSLSPVSPCYAPPAPLESLFFLGFGAWCLHSDAMPKKKKKNQKAFYNIIIRLLAVFSELVEPHSSITQALSPFNHWFACKKKKKKVNWCIYIAPLSPTSQRRFTMINLPPADWKHIYTGANCSHF